MKRNFGAAFAALIAAASLGASTIPASAGGNHHGHHGHHGHGHHGGHSFHRGGVFLDFGPVVVHSRRHGWNRHVRWCLNHYSSYNPHTNIFLSSFGPRRCDSPYF